ncbi:MAG: polymer-forming cytoskeletal protein [Phycisphaerales bacterium]
MSRFDSNYGEQEPRRGMSSGAKIAIGCATVLVLGLALLCGGGIWAYRAVFGRAQEFVAQFEEQGYQVVTSQTSRVTTPIIEPTVFFTQTIVIDAVAEDDLVLVAQTAMIENEMKGDLHFFGQTLTLSDGAVLDGDLHVELAQSVEIQRGAIVRGDIRIELAQLVDIQPGAVIEGTITGDYQVLNRPEAPAAPPVDPGAVETDPEPGSIPEPEPEG